jgi:hypothetical protein
MYHLLESYRGAPCHHTWKNAIVSVRKLRTKLRTVFIARHGAARRRRPTVCRGKPKLHWKRIHNHFQNSFAHPLLAVQFDVSFRRRHLLGNIQIVIAFTILIAPAASRCFTELDKTCKVYSFLKQCLPRSLLHTIWNHLQVRLAEKSAESIPKSCQVKTVQNTVLKWMDFRWSSFSFFLRAAGTGGTFETLPLAQPP